MAVRRARRFGQGEPPPVRGGSGGSSRGRAEPYIPFGWGKRPSSRSRRRDGDEDRGSSPYEPTGRSPIGVDRDYRAPEIRTPGSFSGMSARAAEGWASQGAGPGTLHARGPRYWDGDEYHPATLGPAGIGELQAHLNAAGILGDFRYGVWDSSSAEAYRDLLGEANAMGGTVDQALAARLANPMEIGSPGSGSEGGSGGGSGPGGHFEIGPDGTPIWVEEQYVPPPLELKTTNKKDLARVFRAAVIDTLGQGWTQEQINEVVDAYVWEEMRVQTEAYHDTVDVERAEFMGERAEGGEVISSVSIESPETFLENKMIEKDPVGFQSAQVVEEMVPNFMQMMGGWTGGGG